MALELNLESLVNNLTRSARAWSSISVEGGTRVSGVGSALITLIAHRTGLLPEAAHGALGTVVENATTDLEWLRSSVARLVRIEAGARDAVDILNARPSQKLLTWSLSAEKWVQLVGAVAENMHRDLEDKQRVLRELERATRGIGVHAERVELYAALWLEQPHMRVCVYELPAAVLDAELEAERVHKRNTAMAASPRNNVTAPKPQRESNLSPAMAMLLGGK